MIVATQLLENNPNPTDSQIKAAFTTSGPIAPSLSLRQLHRHHGRRKHAASLMGKGQ